MAQQGGQDGSSGWTPFGRVLRFAERGFAVVGLLTVGCAGLAFYKMRQLRKEKMDAAWFENRIPGSKLPAEFVLELDLDRHHLVEASARKPWERFFRQGSRPLELSRAIKGLKSGAEDCRVKALLTTGSAGISSLAQVQEVRNAVSHFREKTAGAVPTVFYNDTMGEIANGTLQYYLATAFSKVFIQPTGMLSAIGLAYNFPFARELMDKLGVDLLGGSREEYKSAAEIFTERTFTQPHREATEALVGSMTKQIIGGIAESRKLTQEGVTELLNSCPITAAKAVESRLIDDTKYRDEVMDMVQLRGDGKDKLPRVSLSEYAKAQEKEERLEMLKKKKGGQEVVGVVTACGNIHSGWTGTPNRPSVASGRTVQLLQRLRERDEVKAIVMRVDTPGGSAVASDAIRRELVRLREAGKKVVVSMGAVAASGGYYVASGADRIVANPGTITGSIGVLVYKIDARKLADKLGITVESIHQGDNASMLSAFSGLTDQQKDLIESALDFYYNDFVGKVAEARGMSTEAARQVAKGRVWSGEDGLRLGLVDRLGGLEEAVEVARECAGLTKESTVVQYPRPLNPFAQLVAAFQDKDEPLNVGAGLGGEPQRWPAGMLGMRAQVWPEAEVAEVVARGLKGGLGVSGGVQMLSVDAMLMAHCLGDW